jgi:DNA polymerase III delta prime subunit
VDQTQRSVNEDLLAQLLPEHSDLPDIDETRVHEPSYWINYLENSPYELNTLDSLRFPILGGREESTKALRRKVPSLLALSCLAFVERSASSRGIYHELSSLLAEKSLSASLSAFLEENHSAHASSNSALTKTAEDTPVNHSLVPGTLSKAQQQVLETAARMPLGVVSGPPGTGKTYTIAATAAEHFTRGKSVLIVANSDTALDVIGDKLSRDFGLDNLYVRAGQKAVLKEFKTYLDDLLAGYHDHSQAQLSSQLKEDLATLIADIDKDERQLEEVSAKAFKIGPLAHKVSQGKASFFEKLRHKFSKTSIAKGRVLWEISQHFNSAIETKEAKATRYLRAEKERIISQLLSTDRKAVQSLNRAARARSSLKQSEYFASMDFNSVLKGFPVWLVTLNTLHRVLPLNKEMFDLVIVDEATQCNIASALPALARAKRALVVGDKKQLRHFSFISRAKQNEIAQQFGVASNEKAMSYRDNSLLDLAMASASDQQQLAFLDEHFRSQPELIYFSNQHFYSSKLKVMQHRPCSTTGHIDVISIDGKRNASGINEAEANAVLERIVSIITKTKEDTNNAPVQLRKTLGVCSPFSKQVAHIASLIEKHIALEDIQAHQIKVATPYGFQGEERDLMFISFAIDNESKRAAVYLNKPDVFNVAITRARQQQVILKSVDEKSLPSNNLLRAYLAAVNEFNIEHQSQRQPDAFQSLVVEALQAEQNAELHCWQGYEMLGTYIDVLARYKDNYVAIDLIGFPGPWQDYFELSTYKVIKRAGISVLPISYALWLQDKEACLGAIRKALGV